MNSFCTLFDSNYLTRALAMYRSLKASGEDFVLYAVCFDDLAYEAVTSFGAIDFVPISLSKFESPELLSVKNERTVGEYCWTCTPHVIRYVLDTFGLPEVTYLDADLYFFNKPEILLSEFRKSNASVLITPHRYTPRYDQSINSGIYCVQFMTFRSDQRGLTVLNWWQERCIEWCYNRVEDGKFGDQKYLDDWPQRFEGVHVLEHLGGGVAPWNVQQYSLSEELGRINVDAWPLVFYHFHGYKYYCDSKHDLGNYRLERQVVDLLYRPYVSALKSSQLEIERGTPGFDKGCTARSHSWKTPLRNMRRRLKGEFNEYIFV
jgi:hypothetical protein